jgi:beta-N-acetylhexosaminidase
VRSLRRGAALSVLTAGVLALAGCGSGPPPAPAPAAPAPPPAPEPSASAPPSARPSGGDCVHGQLDAMPARTRAGQLFLLGMPADGATSVRAAISANAPGGVFLSGRGKGGAATTRSLLDGVQRSGASAAHGIGMITAVDQEGGQIQVLSGPGLDTMPSASTQGGWSTAMLRGRAERWGQQLRSAGINVDLAPVADAVPVSLGTANGPIGRYHRQYGSDPDAVGSHAAAFAEGLSAAGIRPVVKHFPGLGRVRGNTDTTSGVTDDQTTLADTAAYGTAARAGNAWTMVSTAVYSRIDPDNPAAFSPTVLAAERKITPDGGLILSDDLGVAKQVASVSAGQRAVRFLAAGGDVALTASAGSLGPMIDAVVARAGSDPEFAARVADAETRVLTAKQSMGLLRCPAGG